MQDRTKITDVIGSARNISSQLGLRLYISKLDDISPLFYISCLEKLTISLPFVKKQTDEEIVQFVMDTLEASLGTKLSHISPESIVRKDLNSIHNLLEIFSELVKAQLDGVYLDQKITNETMVLMRKILSTTGLSNEFQLIDCEDINSVIFSRIIEKLNCAQVDGIIVEPKSIEEEEKNMSKILDLFEANLGISLSHIKPNKLASKDPTSMKYLVELLDGLLQGLSNSSKTSEVEKVMTRLTNNMLSRLNIDLSVASIKEIDDVVFVGLFEALCAENLSGIVRPSKNKKDKVKNVQRVIDTLATNILNTSLHHITGVQIIEGNQTAIVNLLEIFSEMMEYFLEVISETSSISSDVLKNNKIEEATLESSNEGVTSRTSDLIGYADVSIYIDKNDKVTGDKNQTHITPMEPGIKNSTITTNNIAQCTQMDLSKIKKSVATSTSRDAIKSDLNLKPGREDSNKSKIVTNGSDASNSRNNIKTSTKDKCTQYTPRSPCKSKNNTHNTDTQIEKNLFDCKQFNTVAINTDFSDRKEKNGLGKENVSPHSYDDYLKKYYGNRRKTQEDCSHKDRYSEKEKGECSGNEFNNFDDEDRLIVKESSIDIEKEIDILKQKLLKSKLFSCNSKGNITKRRQNFSSVLLPKPKYYEKDSKRCRSSSPRSNGKMCGSHNIKMSNNDFYADTILNKSYPYYNEKNSSQESNYIKERKALDIKLKNMLHNKKCQSARIRKCSDEIDLKNKSEMLRKKKKVPTATLR